MHPVAPYLLTALAGAAVPTVGVTVLVGKNGTLTKERDEAKKANENNKSQESKNKEWSTRKRQ